MLIDPCLLQSDSWRSFLFILLSFGVLFAFIKEKLNKKYAILLIGALLIADMWNINKRYLNDEHFVRKNKVKNAYKPTQADNFILKDKDPNFLEFLIRVLVHLMMQVLLIFINLLEVIMEQNLNDIKS